MTHSVEEEADSHFHFISGKMFQVYCTIVIDNGMFSLCVHYKFCSLCMHYKFYSIQRNEIKQQYLMKAEITD